MADKETRIGELSRIQQRDGQIQASVLVEESRPKNAPLHDDFEWSDKKCGVEYRLIQARRIIKVTPVRATEDSEPEPVYHVEVRTAESTEGVYKPESVIVRSRGDTEAALAEMMADVKSIEAKIERLAMKAGGKMPQLTAIADSVATTKSLVELALRG